MGVPKKIEPETETEKEQYVEFKEAILTKPPGSCRRMILIDGANLIHSGDASGRKILDIKGVTEKLNGTSILVVVYMFLKHGFEVMVLMKKFFSENKSADNNFILAELNRLEVLRFIDDGLNDDSVLLRSAEFYGAAVISRDKFRQIYYDRFPKGKASVVSYKISRREVTIEEQKAFSVPGAMVDLACKINLKDFDRLFVSDNHPDFPKVQNVYKQYVTSGALNNTFSAINILVDFLQCEYSFYSRYPMPLLPYFTERQPTKRFDEFKKQYDSFVSSKPNQKIMRKFHDSMLKL